MPLYWVLKDSSNILQNVSLNMDISTKVDKTTTVNGHNLSWNVTVTKGDVWLGNADNTSDNDKPISTATQSALNTLTTNVYTANSTATTASTNATTALSTANSTASTVSGMGVWQSYTPTFTWWGGTPSGNVTKIGRWCQIGNIVFVHIYFSADNGAGASSLSITPPTTIASTSSEKPMVMYHMINGISWTDVIWNANSVNNKIEANYWNTATDWIGIQVRVQGFYEKT